jgi:phosphoribosylamine--glycine ligase
MGAYSPTGILPDDEAQDAANELIAPVARALVKRDLRYRGVIYAGLIRTPSGWRVLEYNARFGDPEAQVTLPRIGGDFARLMLALGEGRLAQYVAEHPVRFGQRAYVSVALCSEGYPGRVETGHPIEGLESLPEGVWAFHSATKRVGSRLVTSGGRVIHLVGGGDNVAEARARAYAAAEKIGWPGRFYRSDIAAGEVAVA